MNRRIDATVGAIVVVAGALFGETPLIVVISFLVVSLGLWRGFLAFSLIWGVGGLVLVPIYDQVSNLLTNKFGGRFGKGKSELREGFRHGWIARATATGKPVGAFVNAMLLGPVLGIPVFKALGYKGLALYLWVFASAPIFGAIWVLGVYGRAAYLLVGDGR